MKLAVLVCAILLSSASIRGPPYRVHAAGGQGVPLYLHLMPANVTVAGTLTRQVLNTTTLWDNPSPSPNLRNTLYNFTLYPVLALNLSSSGSGSIRLWVTVSGAPGTLNATIYDVSGAGQTAVVTTSTGVADSTDPNTPYEVTIPFAMNHNFSQSSTIKLSLTASKVAQLYLYYDSAAHPDVVVLPALNVPRVSLVETFDSNVNPVTSFSLNWTDQQRVVLVHVHVVDPFGAYDMLNATVSIFDPGSSQVYAGTADPSTTSPGDPEKLFSVNWSYLQNSQPGNYAISVLAYNLSGEQASGSGSLNLAYTTQPLGPPGTRFPLLYILVAIGAAFGLLALLGFLFFWRRVKCPKCGMRVNPRLAQCPKCGGLLKPSKANSQT